MRRPRSTRARRAIWERFNRTCQMCFQPTDERGYDLDHHIPLEIGGDDTDNNLRPLCRPCHRLKTGIDRTDIAKAHRREANHDGSRSRKPWPKAAGFTRPEPQRSATRKVEKIVPRLTSSLDLKGGDFFNKRRMLPPDS
jgi:5-methylcytosine-specific restriction protein A